MEQGIRLQKYMAEAGIGSRRKCEEWIVRGMVQVNGSVVTELGTRVNPKRDIVFFRGKPVEPPSEMRTTVLLNKPA